jgi:allene oxide cyclase
VGQSQGSCVRAVVGASSECSWTTILPDGQITVQGPFEDDGESVLAITGGTGAYAGASGEMGLSVFEDPETPNEEYLFVFSIIEASLSPA